ncbi:hypothetical protein [Rhodohalobacter sp. SW132]|uniref:hypothetical protein n=1 Tax=Rhodohalobacter sp. SW132 TaxID=2293433 RepID=UPI001F306D4B|nr:hypothetical protein [Rhodohalobacter sp. SW132]
MKKSLIISVLSSAFLLLAFSGQSHAQDRYSNTELGIILGEPTGISLKMWQSDQTAFDAGFAWSFGGSGSVHIHSDYLRHNWLDSETGGLALYYGLGARVRLADDARLGVRIPVGLQFNIPDTRLATFFEVAPLLDLIPETTFDVNGGLGIRIFI